MSRYFSRSLPVALGVLLLQSGSPGVRAQPEATVSPAPADSVRLPITQVTLYTSGVGYFERGGVVDGEAAQTLLFPVGQINDVLKSLVVLDGGGGRVHLVSYGALDPVSKQLQAFSVDLSDNPEPAVLFNRLRGASVTITSADPNGAKTLTGTIVGVQTQTVALPNNGGTTAMSTLTLLADDGLHTVPLAAVTDTQINDPALRDELKAALAVVAQRRDASKRPVSLSFTGRGKRNVLVGYLTEAPLWQSSYRLVLGKKPVLQGWAMVQNTSQDDWKDIHLSLVSGRPISFLQDLYTPLYVPRPIVQASVLGSPTPQTYNGDLEGQQVAAGPAADEPPGLLPGFPLSSASTGGLNRPARVFGLQSNNSLVVEARRRQSQQNGYQVNGVDIGGASNYAAAIVQAAPKTNGAKLGTALFSYTIDGPVSIARQKSAMIPFVAGAVQADPVSIYNAAVQAEHPLSGARLKNTTGLHLMGGPLTVFDETGASKTGYVGDALIDDTEPGQTRLISYAIDLGVDAAVEQGAGTGHVVSVLISQGTLIVKHHYEQSHVYTFKNNSATPRTVVVEHPYHGEDWKLLEPLAATERTADLYRFDLPLAAHASKKLLIREAYPESDTFALTDVDLPSLLTVIRTDAPNAAVSAALQDVIARRQKIAGFQSRLADIDTQTQAISAGQQRIRENMNALDHNSALYQRYVGELDAQETKLNELAAQKATLQAELTRAQADLNESVAHLTLS